MWLIHIVADYGPGDLAFSEMVSRLCASVGEDFHLWPTVQQGFDTVGTGFCVAQLAGAEAGGRPAKMLIYANCAPRKDLSDARKNNQGEKLVYGVLKNGVPLVIVNSGYSLSFVKEQLAELWSVDVGSGGSQFRSRDLFPPIVGKVTRGDLSFRREQLDISHLPDPPASVVAYVDSFGNIKTSARANDPVYSKFKPGQEIDVTINGITRPAFVAFENFNVREGTLAFSLGSSGFENRYWELFLRGGSAFQEFGKPHHGEAIKIAAGNS